jgi:hypothetical protein
MTARGHRALDAVAELADRIAAAVTGCPDVAGLTQIPGRPVATYLLGRTVSGVAVRPAEVEICVVARYGPPLPQVAAHVRQAVEPLVPGRVVDVVIADITSPHVRPEAGMVSADCRRAEHHNERKAGESSHG